MKGINQLLSAIIFAGVVGFIGWQYVQVEETAARNSAINDCMEIARYTYNNNAGTTTLEVVDNYFLKCMEAKNIQ